MSQSNRGLPLLLSVPHAGLWTPPEVEPYCRLTAAEIIADGDEGAAEIYALSDDVNQFVTTEVARAFVDMNRAEDDRRPDGVVKTHTCWNVPVYDPFPPEEVIHTLLRKYYHPYHECLSEAAKDGNNRLGVDGHTMAAVAPPIGPDPGQPRPDVCLGDVDGATLPEGWMRELAGCFRDQFDGEVSVNSPFRGGYVTRNHGQEMPWVQVELSRAPFLPNEEKRRRVLAALTDFCSRVL